MHGSHDHIAIARNTHADTQNKHEDATTPPNGANNKRGKHDANDTNDPNDTRDTDGANATNASSVRRCRPVVCGGVRCAAGALDTCVYLDGAGRETYERDRAVTPGRCACRGAQGNSSGFGGDACELSTEAARNVSAYRRRLLDELEYVRRFQAVDDANVRQPGRQGRVVTFEGHVVRGIAS